MASKIEQTPQGDIDGGIREAELRVRAYELWEREGRPEGRRDEHWFRAREELERELEQRLGDRHHPSTPEQIEQALDAQGSINYGKDKDQTQAGKGSGERGVTP